LVGLLIALFSVHNVVPVVSAYVHNCQLELGKIVILSDTIDPYCTLVTENLYKVIKKYYPKSEVIPIYSLKDLTNLAKEEYFIKVYVFHGDLNGIKIGYDKVSWKTLANFLNNHRTETIFGSAAHVIASGDGNILKTYLEPYEGFFVESSPIIDIRLSYFFHLWTIADILENATTYRTEEMLTAGECIRKCALYYFSKDFNDLLSRIIQPVDVFGELPQSDFSEDILNKNATVIQTYPTSLTSIDEKPLLFLGSNSHDNAARISYGGGGSDSNNSFINPNIGDLYQFFTELPSKTGADGPAGKILDNVIILLIDKLREWGFSEPTLGVAKDFLENLKNYLINFTAGLVETLYEYFEEQLPWLVQKLKQELTQPITELTPVERLILLLHLVQRDEVARAFLAGIFNRMLNVCYEFIRELINTLNTWMAEYPPLRYEIHNFWIVYKDWISINFEYVKIEFLPSITLNSEIFIQLMNDTIYGRRAWENSSLEDLLSIVNVVPILSGKFEIKGFGISKVTWLMKILEQIFGVHVEEIFGEGRFTIEVIKLMGNISDIAYCNVREFYFKFSVILTRGFSVFDFFTFGCAGEILAEAAEYVGLGHFSLELYLRLGVEITFAAAEAGASALSQLAFEIAVGMMADLKVLIVGIKGGMDVGAKFLMHSLDSSLEVFLVLNLWFEVYIDLWLFDFDVGRWDDSWEWSIYGGQENSEYTAFGLIDTDGDGLSDNFETANGLNPNSVDTDGDGLNDKFELDVSMTNPANSDSDGDGLSDGAEVSSGSVRYFSNPLWRDTDWDGLSDYDEVRIYKTDPRLYDTDKDGLSDYYEINTTYNFTGTRVTPTVTSVKIGTSTFYNHTDPLNPDTDGDGLLDGQEGIRRSAYYGDKALNGSDPSLFNFGYTHPLDYDTDDDSYEQLANGTMTERKLFYLDWNDGLEVKGKLFNFVNVTTGETYSKVVHTNPCNPDTDNDTASGAIFINSDGRELSLTPPTDPTNGDTDSDGLKDGEEGTADQFTYHTDPNNPDTDNDKLSDGEEVKKNLNPLNPDFDGDQVCDGDEVYRYFTNPAISDTDGDLLLDGEEIFQFYSDPFVSDSDNDTIIDGYEAHVYGTDPVNPDTDSDGLFDNVEIFIHRTNPLSPDTDGDGILDLDELNFYHTNPLSWDTDGDSITALNEAGEMTLQCGDYDEIFAYNTDPTLSDTDKDGLSDAQEVYLSLGSPSFQPIAVNPLSNDTDNDGLLDGMELQIATINTFLYPYSAQIIRYPYGCSPVINDTDGDGLQDGLEVLTYNSNPNATDTDGDTLNDYEEVYIHKTSPAKNDTDGDDLADNVEILGLSPLPTGVHTNATNSDTDGDKLPDGAELLHGSDPLDPDTDGDGILDGAEFDYDDDGLNDGDEFYTYTTNHAVTVTPTAHSGINITSLTGYPAFLIIGGFDNPDSDLDNLTDGQEARIYHTDPIKSDTDGDGFSDGEEVRWGTDPLTWTSPDEFTLKSQLPIYFAGGLAVGAGVTVAVVVAVLFITRRKKKLSKNKPAIESKHETTPPSPPSQIKSGRNTK